ncbi:peptidoglycan-binding protein LysM [Aestuariibius sp. 2305UL40-4]|uniref:peptidoglycan-binding protein LysM n=1 Tax=Aestuariibius violaceus TaxID=3234132 RepID=UPI00345EAC56
MGLWSFVKSAGKDLLGRDDEPTPAILKKEIKDLGLDDDGLDIQVEGDKVKVKGGNLTEEQREKVILAVGNVEGVAEVEDDSDAQPVFHTVKSGETLSAIAKEHFDDPNRYHEIFEANKPMLKNPDEIYPGQNLRIPQTRSA